MKKFEVYYRIQDAVESETIEAVSWSTKYGVLSFFGADGVIISAFSRYCWLTFDLVGEEETLGVSPNL